MFKQKLEITLTGANQEAVKKAANKYYAKNILCNDEDVEKHVGVLVFKERIIEVDD